MPKKIFDIIPPHLISKPQKRFAGSGARSSKAGRTKREKRHGRRQVEKRARIIPLRIKIISTLVVVFVLLLGGYLYFALAQLNVEIWPVTQDISFEEKITADVSADSVDLDKMKISAKTIQVEKELWQEYAATGSNAKGGKAEGTIRVYNKYSPATPVSLITGTHFLSDSGKYFVSTGKVNIPAALVKGSKITPGSVDIKVVAEDPGDSYNIGPSKFSVPKLAGTPYYYTIYAESSGAMSGGFSSDVKVVTSDDIENAKADLTKKLLDQAEEDLKRQLSSGTVLISSAILKEVEESSSLVKVGSEVDKFNYKVKVKVTGLVFNESDLKKFVSDYILALSGKEKPKTILEKSLTMDYKPTAVNVGAGKINIDLTSSAKVFEPIDTVSLESAFAGLSSAKISDIVANSFPDQISKLKINFWPFWVKKAPKNLKHIKVELKFE